LIATAKNRDGVGWLLLGFLFGPFAILIVAATSPIPASARAAATISQSPAVHLHPVPVIADELTKLADLKDRGALSDEEFAAQKARLLS
jgi:hypothetical protein